MKGVRTCTNVTMALLTIFLTSPIQITALHEYAGVLLVILAILHIVINRKMFISILKKRDARHVLILVFDVLSLICIIFQSITAIVLSKYAFSWLPAISGASTARSLHLFFGCWSLVLLSLHTGMHAKQMFNKTFKLFVKNKKLKIVMLTLATLVSLIGAYYFLQFNITSYLFMQNTFFMFADPSLQPLTLLQNATIFFAISYLTFICTQKTSDTK